MASDRAPVTWLRGAALLVVGGMAALGILLVTSARLRSGTAATAARPPAPQAQALQGEIARLQAAVRQGPYDEALHYQLGQLMLDYASPEALLGFFSEELARDQKPQTSH